MKSAVAVLLLATLPMVAVAGTNKIVVRNGTAEEIRLSLDTAQGKPIYNPVNLRPGDRYELNDAEPGTVVHVTSAKCGSLTTDLPGRVDWTVEIRASGHGCELVKSSKSGK
jgi:hypothetical protein